MDIQFVSILLFTYVLVYSFLHKFNVILYIFYNAPISIIFRFKCSHISFYLVYLKTGENSAKNEEEKTILKKFIAYKLEQHHKEKPEVMCVSLMDMTGASTTNTVQIICYEHKYCAQVSISMILLQYK